MKVVPIHPDEDVQVMATELSTTEDQGTDVVENELDDIDTDARFDIIGDPIQQVEGGSNQSGIDDRTKAITNTTVVAISTKDGAEQASKACLGDTSDYGSYPEGSKDYERNQSSSEAELCGQLRKLIGEKVQDEHQDEPDQAGDEGANEQLGMAYDGSTGLLEVAGEEAAFPLTAEEEDRDEDDDGKRGQEGADKVHDQEIGGQGN